MASGHTAKKSKREMPIECVYCPKNSQAEQVVGDENIAKVSVIGVGMRSHSGVAAKMFATLAKENINRHYRE